MREALENMDGCGGVDDVTRQTSNLCLGDDYREVKRPCCYLLTINVEVKQMHVEGCKKISIIGGGGTF